MLWAHVNTAQRMQVQITTEIDFITLIHSLFNLFGPEDIFKMNEA
jgi:hypothetical protein